MVDKRPKLFLYKEVLLYLCLFLFKPFKMLKDLPFSECLLAPGSTPPPPQFKSTSPFLDNF